MSLLASSSRFLPHQVAERSWHLSLLQGQRPLKVADLLGQPETKMKLSQWVSTVPTYHFPNIYLASPSGWGGMTPVHCPVSLLQGQCPLKIVDPLKYSCIWLAIQQVGVLFQCSYLYQILIDFSTYLTVFIFLFIMWYMDWRLLMRMRSQRPDVMFDFWWNQTQNTEHRAAEMSLK